MNPEARIYLDHAATTPLRGEVFEVMRPFMTEHFGNAGSIHRFGRGAKRAVEEARAQVAGLIGADPRDLVFTSGGTEANNLALSSGQSGGRGVLASAIEHHSVSAFIEDSMCLPVDSEGQLCLDALTARLEGEKVLVSVMLGNNETGVIQEIEAIGELCRRHGALFHSDAVPAAGRIPIDVGRLAVDYLSLSAHKLYGPQGVGALYVRRGAPLAAQVIGGAQERGRRAGTENLAGIVGFGAACALAARELIEESQRLERVRDALQEAILARLPESWVNGAREKRLPHLLNMGFPGKEGEEIVLALDHLGIAASTGSACSSGTVDASHVLLAMGQVHEKAHAGVRFSLGRDSTTEQMQRVADQLANYLKTS